MFVPILSTILLLDVSVSSTSNSSLVHHDVVFVRSLPSANSSLTVAEGENHFFHQKVDRTAFIQPVAAWKTSRKSPVFSKKLNELLQSDSRNIEKIFRYFEKLRESNDENIVLFVDKTISDLLRKSATSELTQIELLKSKTPASKIFTSLMLQTQDGSLEEFFRLELHITFLSYATKLMVQEGTAINRRGPSEDLYRILTANRNGETLIAWLGKCQLAGDSKKLIESFIYGLLRSSTTKHLAYRLLSLRDEDVLVLFRILYGPKEEPDELRIKSELLKYAAFIRFNYIEHESKSFSFVVPALHDYLKSSFGLSAEDQRQLFSRKEVELVMPKLDPEYETYKGFSWSEFTEDEVRLFKAALQSNEYAILVREALKANRQVASFANKLGEQNAVNTFMWMLNQEELVQMLQAVLKDVNAVQVAEEIRNENSDLSSYFMKHGADTTIFRYWFANDDRLRVLETSMMDENSLTMFKDALGSAGQLKLVADMLSSTELDTVTILKSILDDEIIVKYLKEAVKDDKSLESFRLALEHTIDVKNIKSKAGHGLKAVLNDMNQVFSLRVAIKDDSRATLFRAALEDKKHEDDFFKALNEKRLTNVFISILAENEKLEWLERAVAKGRYGRLEFDRDDKMLADEMVKYINSGQGDKTHY
ncbi:hypothetical protein Plhal703r1_c18g0082091 [Plasmopara halstedii]